MENVKETTTKINKKVETIETSDTVVETEEVGTNNNKSKIESRSPISKNLQKWLVRIGVLFVIGLIAINSYLADPIVRQKLI